MNVPKGRVGVEWGSGGLVGTAADIEGGNFVPGYADSGDQAGARGFPGDS